MAEKKNQSNKDQNIEKCSPIAIFFMFLFGFILGLVGVLFSHLAISFYKYHFVLLFPVLIGLLIGMGVSNGARIGSCSKQLPGLLLVISLGGIYYALLLMLNNFATSTGPVTVVEEYQYLARDFVDPIQNVAVQDGGNQKGWDRLKRIWPKIVSLVPPYHEKAMVSNHEYAAVLEYPNLIRWDDQRKVLEFEKLPNWTIWLVEFLVLILVAGEKTYRTIRYNSMRVYSSEMLQDESRTFERSNTEIQKHGDIETRVNDMGTQEHGKVVAEIHDAETQMSQVGILQQAQTTIPVFQNQQDVASLRSDTSLPSKVTTPPEQPQAIHSKQKNQGTESRGVPSGIPTIQSLENDQRYAILLQKFDEMRKEEVLHLLASLTNLTVERLRQMLRTPALAVKNVTRDEADRIDQQFKNLNAEVSILTMQELQQRFARK